MKSNSSQGSNNASHEGQGKGKLNSRRNSSKKEESENNSSQKEEIKKPFDKYNGLTSEKIREIAKCYLRIGTDYYLYTEIYTAKKERVKILKKWKKSIIIEDHGKKIFSEIEKFFDFILVPDNTDNYKRNIGGCYNIYEPIQFRPTPGQFPHTENFLAHIFGQYINVGLDYLAIIFTKPAEKLPALCLVSKEQKTGKTTFLHWVSKIFGDNSVILGNEDFGSNFNTSWVSKLIIGIDESFIEKRVIKEKIKRLVTDDKILAENKGIDKVRRDFIGKFILLSNNEENFIQMDSEDNRFFVLKVPSVLEEDPFLEEKLIKEIPAFLHFLQNRELQYKKQSRLWFPPEVYETEALKSVVKSSKTIIEKTMIEHLSDLKDNIEAKSDEPDFKGIKEIHMTPTRLAEQIKTNIRNVNGLHLKIRDIFKSWELTPSEKSERYKYPVFDEETWNGSTERVLKFKSETGKYYKIKFDLLDDLRS